MIVRVWGSGGHEAMLIVLEVWACLYVGDACGRWGGEVVLIAAVWGCHMVCLKRPVV